MEVAWPGGGRQRWVARGGDRASEPLTLEEAKREVVTMLRDRSVGIARSSDEHIAELNKFAAAEVVRVAIEQESKQWPCDLVGGSRHGSMRIDRKQRNAILSAELFIPSTLAEPLTGDEYQLSYDADGNVELPACLDRHKPKPGDIAEFRDNKEAPAIGAARASETGVDL
jgi:hypothetical protein